MRTRPEGEGKVTEDNQYPGVGNRESEERRVLVGSNFGASSCSGQVTFNGGFACGSSAYIITLRLSLLNRKLACYVGFGSFVVYRL